MKIDSNSIENTIKELQKYKDSIKSKNNQFLSKLLDLGIEVGRQNAGAMGNFITFRKMIEGESHCVGLLIAEDSQKLISEWKFYNEVKTAEISPILMSEFGSGKFAEVLFSVEGVGRGTFPGQTHAFQDVWKWKGMDNKWHSSSGFKPSHPMYNAEMQIIEQVYRVAREVFNDGI